MSTRRIKRCFILMLAVNASGCDGCLDVYIGEPEPDGIVIEPDPFPDAGDIDVFTGDFDVATEGTGALGLYRRITGDLRIVGLDAGTLSLTIGSLIVDGDLIVSANPNLTSLVTGGLAHVGGAVLVNGNPQLTSFSTTNLGIVEGDVRIVQNAALSFVGMSNVTQIGGTLTLYAGRNMRFDRLSAIGGSLVVGGPALDTRPPVVTLSFLELGAIGADMLITGLAQLVTMSFPKLASVADILVVRENPLLDTLEMPLLSTVGVSLCLCENPRLSACVAAAIAAQVETSGGITKDTSGNDDDVTCE